MLNFCTGSEYPPILGFSNPIEIRFDPDNDFPTASTCALQLTLPTKFSDYNMFKEKIAYAMFNHGGFGMM